MIALIALVLKILIMVLPSATEPVMVIPAMPQSRPLIDADIEYGWDDFKDDAYEEYYDEFTALFDSYEVKRAKNGALMIRRGNSGSYRFAKKG